MRPLQPVSGMIDPPTTNLRSCSTLVNLPDISSTHTYFISVACPGRIGRALTQETRDLGSEPVFCMLLKVLKMTMYSQPYPADRNVVLARFLLQDA